MFLHNAEQVFPVTAYSLTIVCRPNWTTVAMVPSISLSGEQYDVVAAIEFLDGRYVTHVCAHVDNVPRWFTCTDEPKSIVSPPPGFYVSVFATKRNQ